MSNNNKIVLGDLTPHPNLKTQEGHRKVLKWNTKKYGLMEATIWDGKLSDFRVCEHGSLNQMITQDIEFCLEIRNFINSVLKEMGME